MHTLEVTDEQLDVLHASLNTWINSFSHDEPELLRAGKALRAKLDEEISRTGSTTFGASAPRGGSPNTFVERP